MTRLTNFIGEIMKRAILVPLAIIFCAITTIGFAHTCPESYIGDWRGIDKVDGGEGHKRFWKAHDGFVKNIGNDSWHGPCGYGWPAKTQSDELTCEGNKLVGDWTLYCLKEEGDPTVPLGVRYNITKGHKLREVLVDLNTGEPIDREPIVYTKDNTYRE